MNLLWLHKIWLKILLIFPIKKMCPIDVYTTTVAVELEESQEMHLEFLQPDSGSFRKPFSCSLYMLGISYSPVVIYTTTWMKMCSINYIIELAETGDTVLGPWRNNGFVVHPLNVIKKAHHHSISTISIRYSYTKYFNGPGSVPYQCKQVML